MHFSKNLKRGAKVALATAALAMSATGAMAAGTDTGVEAGFFAIAADISTILSGAGGYLLMIMAVVIGGITLAVSGRWTHVAVAFGVSIFLGYGVDTLASLGGVTASTDLLAQSTVDIAAVGPTTH